MGDTSTGRPRRTWRTLVAAVLGVVLALLLAAGLLFAWVMHTWERGKTLPESERVAAQAVVDRCFADYPLRVVRASEHSGFFNSVWREYELRSVQDPGITQTANADNVEELAGRDCMALERLLFKVARDGERGPDPSGLKLPPELADQLYFHHYDGVESHPRPKADFTTHEPYPWPPEVRLSVDRETQYLGTDDAALIGRMLEASRQAGATVVELRYHLESHGRNDPSDWFDLTEPALSSPTLQQDMARAKQGAAVRGITYRAVP